MDELTEIKTVVSEAVTNAIIHGYNNEDHHYIKMICVLFDDEMTLTIQDNGIGMDNIEEKRQPLYTSKPELERSGMGFTIIENFMDKVEISSHPNEGTSVHMTKQLATTRTVSKYGCRWMFIQHLTIVEKKHLQMNKSGI